MLIKGKHTKYEIKRDKLIQSIVIWKCVETKDTIGDDPIYVLKHSIHIPYTPHAFYIHFIYPHLGICHKDLRSKWYIGKAREER